ncbi:ribonuclease E activity regulator RraA [Vibrio sp.]|nr:ribonuclease E activity regulator RraA [Vibrio sp.]
MTINTSALCDIYGDQIDVVEPIFSNYGGRSTFSGKLTTVKCFEDCGIIREVLEHDGLGRVLLIDGGGSLRRALIDVDTASIAVENNWEGIVVYGAVREVDELDELDLGIQAMGSIPVGASEDSIGNIDIPVNFASVTFMPEDYLYADNTGVILSQELLDLDTNILDSDEEEIPE